MSHPRIEEVSDSDFDSDPAEGDIDDFADSDIMRRVEPTGPRTAPAAAAPPRQEPAIVPADAPVGGTMPASADRSAYADFQCLYPVYFDASRSRAEGRRVGAELAVKDPLAREIANACSRLRLPTLFEPEKVHPKDWANPGRVKVGLKKTDGHPVKNKHHLYRLVADHLRENPTTEDSPGLRVRIGGQLQPEPGKPYPKPAVPRGWKMGELVPYLSAAMTGGGVSENLFKDMMKEMQGGGDPMSALMGAQAGGGGGEESSGGGKKKKDKKGKGKA
ncbi:signal recognition particle, SRP19 subunit [Fusarium flagelliforme]|uniref:Signal recognition particle subunit srp19 n=1 Tax=Fusarium flagelliforme TaxID=2675880 RepID=A0A395N5M0_9HYPO|nr:signal recognition particle, SRP19 subunit [Fusarium flagelliforme]KAH7192235.1 signal recognition particle, SRP19 subunit [Fusarium flagelliforme]RFN55412.1 signal recognition particle subunit srp19 [Fusarium flagelliforme]